MTAGPRDVLVHGTFGAGGSEPYARALDHGTGDLELWDAYVPGRSRPVAVERFARPADGVDLRVLARARGAVLDVGCGPGRMLAAAIGLGLPVLGLDLSSTAVRLARAAGLPVLHRSVFDPAPGRGLFATVLLLDGNVGIGGSPATLLRRCSDLVMAAGDVIVELDAEPEADRTFTAVLRAADGGRSDPFPWAEVGRAALARHARAAGLREAETWFDSGRAFSRLERR